MAKDYVRRGRSPKKSTPKNAPRKKRPWLAGLLAVVLLGGFGYGLYTLSNDPEPPAPVVENKPVSKPKPKKDLPPPPEEKWQYVETLPNREIEVVAKAQEAPKIPYIMQCGAYKSLEQAESRKLDIAFQGITSTVKKKEGSDWYRVVLGPYKLKRDAERDRHKLQRAKIEPCAIWQEAQ